VKRSPMRRRVQSPKLSAEDAAFRLWIQSQPCLVCGKAAPSEFAHVRHRGMGGKDVPWVGNGVPLCAFGHHAEQHALGVLSWQRKHGVDLEEEAERYAILWRRERLQGEYVRNG